MTDQQIEDLLLRYRTGNCTQEEKDWVLGWYLNVEASLSQPVLISDDQKRLDKLWLKMNKKQRPSYYLPVAAAAALILISGVAYFSLRKQPATDLYTYNKQHDLPAGANKAVLVLANGQRINLDDAKSGTLANQSGVTITKNKAGQLIYKVIARTNDEAISYNTICTLNGGQYEIILPDGSHVYLNAASSLKYPIKFTGNKRTVTLTGEGYFEITKNPSQPFIVSSLGQTVTVLGTHFNITSYPTEITKTTLAEGKIIVTSTSPSLPSRTLIPGQQTINTGNALQVKSVNVENEIAWKDGLFIFRNTPIKEVLQQICRWYDVSVDYSSLPERNFDGELSRDAPLSETLKILELTNHVNLKIEGRRINIQN